MGVFLYEAVDQHGKDLKGSMEARDEKALEEKLSSTGHYLLSSKLDEAKSEKDTKKVQKLKVKREEIGQFFASVGQLMSAGVSISDCLSEVAKDSDNKRLKAIVTDIYDGVNIGLSLADAMERHLDIFDQQTIDLVRAGEHSGNLIETFDELRIYIEWVDQLVKQVKQASIYPTMVVIAVVIFIGILFAFVVPEFAKILVGLGIPLPFPTKVVIGTGDFMHKYWWAVFGGGAGIIYSIKITLKHSERIRFKFDEFKLKVPVFGPLNKMIALSRLTHNLSMLIKAGVPIIEALDLCSRLTGSPVINLAIINCRESVSIGSSLADAVERQEIFPSLLLRMLSVGEQSGTLDTSLKYVSDTFDKEIPTKLKKIFGIVEPAIILVLVGIVGFVSLALFLPMVGMMGAIK